MNMYGEMKSGASIYIDQRPLILSDFEEVPGFYSAKVPAWISSQNSAETILRVRSMSVLL